MIVLGIERSVENRDKGVEIYYLDKADIFLQNRSKMVLEICSGSLQSAINAQAGGADRVELCCNLEQGGLTPSPATIQLARAKLRIDIFVLIRPRIGDFNYSETALEQMYADIEFCKKVGVDGVVFGVLNEQSEVAIAKNKYLLKAAEGLQTTFHRAFDCLDDPLQGLAEVINLGFDRILTSGLASTAIKGQDLIKTLIGQA
ncbi:MAG: copper homeostasis protein CutC, partial [Bacteroidota bacterium]